MELDLYVLVFSIWTRRRRGPAGSRWWWANVGRKHKNHCKNSCTVTKRLEVSPSSVPEERSCRWAQELRPSAMLLGLGTLGWDQLMQLLWASYDQTGDAKRVLGFIFLSLVDF